MTPLRLAAIHCVRGLPDSFERSRSALLEFLAVCHNTLNFFTERIDLRIGMPPGIDECGLVKEPDYAPDLLQLEQARAFGNEQPDSELNRRHGI